MDRRMFLRFLSFLITIIAVSLADVSGTLRRVKRIVGGRAAATPPEDDPVVFTSKNDREARIYGTRDNVTGYYLFRGIRYAVPPVGERRFQRSSPLYPEGDVNATQWGPPCPQLDENGTVIGTEDCLTLNVFSPALPDASEGHPVIIWIHGGGFRKGAASQYETRHLVKQKLVVVSIQYRLGSLGFLNTGTKRFSGNNGLFDMILATEWVKNYIEFFGGNPKRIVAFGQGSGASSAFLICMSNFAKNYFSGIVAMSGTILSRFAIDRNPKNTVKIMAKSNGCPTNDTIEMVRCLREIPAAKLIEKDDKEASLRTTAGGFITDLSELLGPGPISEDEDDRRSLPNIITRTPEESVKLAQFPNIPLLTGVVKEETTNAVNGPYNNEIVHKLKTIPDFFNKYLVTDLQVLVPNLSNVSKQFVTGAFSKYLTPLTGSGKKNGIPGKLIKVAEALGDAIFNVPAFLAVKEWSKKSKAFLYSFDHKVKRHFGKYFLGDLPIVKGQTDKQIGEAANHGDDLGYIFEPNTIFGDKINIPPVDSDDEKVRDTFVSIVAQFARSGDVFLPSKSPNGSSWIPNALPSFSDDEDSFISISSKPEFLKNFRYCEMGLWTGLAERLQSSSCTLFKSTLEQVDRVQGKAVKAVEDTLTGKIPGSDILSKASNGVADKISLGSVFGSDKEKKTTTKKSDTSTKVKKPTDIFPIGLLHGGGRQWPNLK